jgi:hypothetical protein
LQLLLFSSTTIPPKRIADTDGQTFKYLNVFARIESCEKWADVRRNLAKNKDEQYNPNAPALPHRRAAPSSARRS